MGGPYRVLLENHTKNGSLVKAKGWPWVQAALRGLLGKEKVEKANFLQDGSLLIKTKSQTQTEKLLQATSLLKEECQVVRDAKLNVSKGTIFASDLQELSEEEVVQWLDEFGVVGAKKFTRKGKVVQTPNIQCVQLPLSTCPHVPRNSLWVWNM